MNISKYGDKLRQTMKPIILPEQKERFEEYYTRKAFRIERNMAGIIIAMQACMILIFSFRKGGPFISPRRIGYFFAVFHAADSDGLFPDRLYKSG